MRGNHRSDYETLMECLGPCDPPLVAYYCDTAPVQHIGPKGGFFIRMNGIRDVFCAALNYRKLLKVKNEQFRCMFQFLMKTRATGVPSVFSAENFGCPGFRFYSGYIEKLPSFNHYFVTTGIPGIVSGERLMHSPSSSKNSAAKLEGRTPKGKYLVFAPFDRCAHATGTGIEVVIFFANPEIITGLVGLIRFVTDDDEGVRSIYCSGCASIFSWPVQLQRQGKMLAVLGVFDPAARPWLKNGEMTLAMPFRLFEKILSRCRESFIYKHVRYKTAPGDDLLFGWKDVLRRARDFNKRMVS